MLDHHEELIKFLVPATVDNVQLLSMVAKAIFVEDTINEKKLLF